VSADIQLDIDIKVDEFIDEMLMAIVTKPDFRLATAGQSISESVDVIYGNAMPFSIGQLETRLVKRGWRKIAIRKAAEHVVIRWSPI